MSPLMVIRTLAGSPLSNLGNVRPYLLSVCQSEQKQVDEHARVIEQYRVETNQVRQRIHDLQSQALTLKQTKCSGKYLPLLRKSLSHGTLFKELLVYPHPYPFI